MSEEDTLKALRKQTFETVLERLQHCENARQTVEEAGWTVDEFNAEYFSRLSQPSDGSPLLDLMMSTLDHYLHSRDSI